MLIKVKRKDGAEPITSFSLGDRPGLVFPATEDVFEIPIEYLTVLADHLVPHFPVSMEEKQVSAFMAKDLKGEMDAGTSRGKK